MEYKQIENSWKKELDKEIAKPYFKKLCQFLNQERKNKEIFPKKEEVLAAFCGIAIDFIKVVIVGQDPYPTKGYAKGLAFASNIEGKIPPSLRNIYKEIKTDTKMPAQDFSLLKEQGVFLLNTILTVEEGAPLSHKGKGWEMFTDQVLKILWQRDEKIVFLLWGNLAQKKEKELFTTKKGHLVLKAAHPSPLSARNFFGCNHFTQANAFLKKERNVIIDWNRKKI